MPNITPSITPSIHIDFIKKLIKTLDFDTFFNTLSQETIRLLNADSISFVKNTDNGVMYSKTLNTKKTPNKYKKLINNFLLPKFTDTIGLLKKESLHFLFISDYKTYPECTNELKHSGLSSNLVINLGFPEHDFGTLTISWFNKPPIEKPHDKVIEDVLLLSDMLSHKLYHHNLELQLFQKAHIDSLTNLNNRLGLITFFDNLNTKAYDQNKILAVAMLDLDNFKMINDIHGHAAGDELLILLAQRLQLNLKKTDYIARLGGDEFLIVFTDLSNKIELDNILTRLEKALSANYVLKNNISVTCHSSIGVTIFQDSIIIPEKLIKQADLALYQSKNDKLKRFTSWKYHS
jgi:diguanylate cyclase (GGDEF)-like protein